MFKNIDFSPGIVTYNDFDTDLISFLTKKQISEKDLMQIRYPNGFLLDVGWRDNQYVVCIIKNYDWINRIFKKKCKTLNVLEMTLEESSNKIKALIKEENTRNFGRKNVFADMDFSPGEIHYSDLYIDQSLSLKKNSKTWPEQLAQITYPNVIVIDLRSYHNKLMLSVIKNWQWNSPIIQKTSTSLEELKEDLLECIVKAQELAKSEN